MISRKRQAKYDIIDWLTLEDWAIFRGVDWGYRLYKAGRLVTKYHLENDPEVIAAFEAAMKVA